MIAEKMDKLAEEICNSLESEPENWKFETYTFKHKKGRFYSASFWEDDASLWDGNTRHHVFTRGQASKIKRSYRIARSKVGSELQNKLLESVSIGDKDQGKEVKNKSNFESDLRNLINDYGVSEVVVHDSWLFGGSIVFEFEDGEKKSIHVDGITK